MCKIVAFTNTKNLNIKPTSDIIGNVLLKTEKDGFGYAVKSKSGVFGEKCVAQNFSSRIENKNKVSLPIIKNNYTYFGKLDEPDGPGIFHGRTCTNVPGLLNTHPIQRNEWHLIHNGVVEDLGPPYNKNTNNDSEDVLYRLIEGNKEFDENIIDNPMHYVENYLEGYYAFAAIDPNGRLHIARDQYATLYIAWSEVLDSYIIATTYELMMDLDVLLEAEIGPIDEIQDDIYLVFNGNEIIRNQQIYPLGFTVKQSKHSVKSLGRKIEVYSNGEIVEKSENDWPTLENQFLDALEKDRSEYENDYYNYKREIDNMDSSYKIMHWEGYEIDVHEFYKLDYISQERCVITRPDGTLLELDNDLMFKNQLA